jgi:hypothetical protein
VNFSHSISWSRLTTPCLLVTRHGRKKAFSLPASECLCASKSGCLVHTASCQNSDCASVYCRTYKRHFPSDAATHDKPPSRFGPSPTFGDSSRLIFGRSRRRTRLRAGKSLKRHFNQCLFCLREKWWLQKR